MRIFVTGATGVIGRRAVPLVVCRGHQVTGVGRSSERLKTLERAGATPLVLDLFDREAVRRSIDGFDAVVNLATHIPPLGLKTFFASSWKETGRIRAEGSSLLVDEALSSGARLFIQ